MKKYSTIVGLWLFLAASWPMDAFANGTITPEPGEDSYRFDAHYRISIDAPVEDVWRQLMDLGSWMVDFAMTHVSGETGKTGEVLRLYPEQDFLVQITSVVPNESLVVANLPVHFKGEFSTGTTIITLYGSEGTTTVDLTMSRRYTWEQEGENPFRSLRSSPEFMENSSAMWRRFLEQLRTLSEGS
jgi:hypothetical protein